MCVFHPTWNTAFLGEQRIRDLNDTINGLLISRLDRIPGDDEQPEIEYLGYRFCVLKVENKMIHSVRVTKLPQTLASEEN